MMDVTMSSSVGYMMSISYKEVGHFVADVELWVMVEPRRVWRGRPAWWETFDSQAGHGARGRGSNREIHYGWGYLLEG